MRYVHTIDKNAKQVAASVPIAALEVTDSIPAAQQYETAAWKMAVKDQLVDPRRKADYSFKIVDTEP
jgi:hypothetical protein